MFDGKVEPPKWGDRSLTGVYIETTNKDLMIQELKKNYSRVYDTVKEEYENQFKLTWLDYAQANDGQGIFVSKEVADQYGINWPDIDEDLSFEGFFNKKERTPLYRLFLAHPELNASAVARRMGISQSLFAQYISGTKKPSKERLAMIYSTIHDIGNELLAIPNIA